MPSRRVNFEQMHEIELDYMFQDRLGKGSIFQQEDAELYRLAKEKFVSNLNGTHWIEIVAVISLLPLSFILLNAVLNYLKLTKRITLPSFARFVTEFIFLIVPTIFMFCNHSRYVILYLIVFHLAAIGMIAALSKHHKVRIFDLNLHEMAHGCYENKKSYISFYRTALMIYTILSILAVDFTVYPRKYAKCETYGFSLMDVGVGSFMLALGVISVAKKHSTSNKPKQARNLRNFFTAFRSSMPLFLFGVGRFVLTSLVDYHTHVSEYGVHWNFFFTMFVVTFCSYFIDIAPQNAGKIAIILAVPYQLALDVFATDYVLHEPRIEGNFISQNKEGIISCIGFFICYTVGQSVGWWCVSEQRRTKKHVLQFMVELSVMLVLVICCCYFMHQFVENVSRRLANAGYILYVLGCNLWIILLFLVASLLLFHPTESVLLTAINENQLLCFLFANLLTGLVNMSCKTLFATPFVAYSIITAYMFVVCAVCYLLHLNRIKIKL